MLHSLLKFYLGKQLKSSALLQAGCCPISSGTATAWQIPKQYLNCCHMNVIDDKTVVREHFNATGFDVVFGLK
jgi:hypothetical protein